MYLEIIIITHLGADKMPVPGPSEPWALMETGRVGSMSRPQVGGWGPTVDPTGPHTRDAVSLKKKKNRLESAAPGLGKPEKISPADPSHSEPDAEGWQPLHGSQGPWRFH